MSGRISIRVGGWSLIVGAVAFVAVFTYLAGAFGYPEVLDGPADVVLPGLLATGSTGRAVWTLYAFLPLIWIPAGVGAYVALRGSHPGSALLGAHAALVAALAMMLGLMRWPTVHWRLATLYETADASQRAVVEAVFDGLNAYLGNYIGEFLGELAFSLYFLLVSWALLRTRAVPRGVAVLGLATGTAGLVGMFRNLTDVVAPVAAVNNYLLPLWMIVLGVILVRWKTPMPAKLATLVALLCIAAPTSTAAQETRAEAGVRALVQAQADAFNRGDLEGTMATFSREVDWRTVNRQLIEGHDALERAMRGWIEGLGGNNIRLVYPPELVSVRVLRPDLAVADVVLYWEDATPGPGPKRESREENLFLVVERGPGGWLIVNVRNTTTGAEAVGPPRAGIR